MKVAKYKVSEYGTTVRTGVELAADNLRMGAGSATLRDLEVNRHDSEPSAASAQLFLCERSTACLSREAQLGPGNGLQKIVCLDPCWPDCTTC